jgi:plastocyanin
MALEEYRLKKSRLGPKQSIAYVVILVIIVVLILAFAAGYYAGTGTSATSVQTTTVMNTNTVSSSGVNVACVSTKTCPSSIVYFAFGAHLNSGTSLNPGDITVVIGVNNTVTWENLDTVAQTVVGGSGLNSGSLAPGATYQFTFSTPGTFSYSNPAYSWEKGTVTVVQSTATTSAIGSNPDDNY